MCQLTSEVKIVCGLRFRNVWYKMNTFHYWKKQSEKLV